MYIECRVYFDRYSLIHEISIFYSMTGIFLSDFSRLLKHQNFRDMLVAASEKISFKITQSKVYETINLHFYHIILDRFCSHVYISLINPSFIVSNISNDIIIILFK